MDVNKSLLFYRDILDHRRETGLAGKRVWEGNWFGSETGLAWKLVWQGNWFGRETGLAGKLVWQGN